MQQSQPLISVLHRLQSDRAWLEALKDQLGFDGIGLQNAGGDWITTLGTAPPLVDWKAVRTAEADAHTLTSGTQLLALPLLTAYETNQTWCFIWAQADHAPARLFKLLAHATSLLAQNTLAQHRQAADHHAEIIERAAATASIGVWSCTLPQQTLSWSDGVYDLFELPRRSLVARDEVLKLYTPESAAKLDALRTHAIATLGNFTMDADIITATGKHRVMRITAAVDHDHGVPTQIFGVKQDITAERALVERTRILAETDPLTGVANRMRFQQCLDDLHGDKRGRAVGALMLIDLDNFKTINDTLGHLAGDACLIETAKRLNACAPVGALVARLGGDEFAVITDATAPCDNSLPKRVLEAFAEPIMLNGQPCQIGVSIGIAKTQPSIVADMLYHNADLALYQAKQSGRGTWRHYQAA